MSFAPASRYLLGLALALGAASCSALDQADEVRPSKFLGDISMLEKGADDRALLVWFDESVDWSAYKRVLIDPITIWASPDSAMNSVDPEQTHRLAQLLRDRVQTALAEDYQIARGIGPKTLRIRAAITEASESSPTMDVISMVIPVGIVMSGVTKLATGTASFVGSASVEVELLDATTGRRLAAAIDRRTGGKSFEGAGGSWNDVEAAYEFWATRLRDRLREQRGQTPGS